MNNLVFTYGTLMKNQRAFGKFGEMECVGDAILDGYGLYEVEAGYPAAVPVKGFKVYGEVYSITDEQLKKLDEYEVEGDLYIRKQVIVEVSRSKQIEVWFYEYNHSIEGLELRTPVGKWNTTRNPFNNNVL